MRQSEEASSSPNTKLTNKLDRRNTSKDKDPRRRIERIKALFSRKRKERLAASKNWRSVSWVATGAPVVATSSPALTKLAIDTPLDEEIIMSDVAVSYSTRIAFAVLTGLTIQAPLEGFRAESPQEFFDAMTDTPEDVMMSGDVVYFDTGVVNIVALTIDTPSSEDVMLIDDDAYHGTSVAKTVPATFTTQAPVRPSWAAVSSDSAPAHRFASESRWSPFRAKLRGLKSKVQEVVRKATSASASTARDEEVSMTDTPAIWQPANNAGTYTFVEPTSSDRPVSPPLPKRKASIASPSSNISPAHMTIQHLPGLSEPAAGSSNSSVSSSLQTFSGTVSLANSSASSITSFASSSPPSEVSMSNDETSSAGFGNYKFARDVDTFANSTACMPQARRSIKGKKPVSGYAARLQSRNNGPSGTAKVVGGALHRLSKCTSPTDLPVEHQNFIKELCNQQPIAVPEMSEKSANDVAELPRRPQGTWLKSNILRARKDEPVMSKERARDFRTVFNALTQQHPDVLATVLGEQLQLIDPEKFLGGMSTAILGRPWVIDYWRIDQLAAILQAQQTDLGQTVKTDFHTDTQIPLDQEYLRSRVKDMMNEQGGYQAFREIVAEWAQKNMSAFQHILRKAGWVPLSDVATKAETVRFIEIHWQSSFLESSHCSRVLKSRCPRFWRYVRKHSGWAWDD